MLVHTVRRFVSDWLYTLAIRRNPRALNMLEEWAREITEDQSPGVDWHDLVEDDRKAGMA